MKLVDALVSTLKDWKVRFVFGVSGANIEHLHDSIHRLGDGELSAVLAKSEVGAAFMADARARVHRTLGVCCATSGGGMMNLAVGLAESYAESVPVLAIIGQPPSTLSGRGAFQDSSGIGRTVDALALFGAMTKYSARIDDAGAFWEALHAAAQAALEGRQGPSVLLVPRDLYDREVGPRPAWFPRDLAEMSRPVVPAGADLFALFEAILAARRPVLVIGTGASRSGDAAAVVRFAMAAGIPVVTTMANPGSFPNDHPLYLGVLGAAGHPSAHAYLNEQADLIIAVGSGLNALTRQPIGPALARCRLAVVNVDPGEITRALAPAIVVRGDAGLAFRELSAMLDVFEVTPSSRRPFEGQALRRYVAELAEGPSGVSSGVMTLGPARPLRQSEAMDVLQPHLPEDGHLLFDAGNCASAALHYLHVPRRATSTIALGMGGMGYAIAAAIGAQLGEEAGRRTVVFCGDGAFLMLGLEVHTAVDLGLPILFVVFNNGKHGMCVTRQNLFFEGRLECTEYSGVEVATVARGLGQADKLWVGRAGTRGELGARLAEYAALPDGRPGVLELSLICEEMPPFAPFLDGNAETYVAARPAPADPVGVALTAA
jgi:acetolactate synthase I/II/III large subunit